MGQTDRIGCWGAMRPILLGQSRSWRKAPLCDSQTIVLAREHDCGPGETKHLMSPRHLGFQTLGQVLLHHLPQRPYWEETNAARFYRWLRLAVTDRLVGRHGEEPPGVTMLQSESVLHSMN